MFVARSGKTDSTELTEAKRRMQQIGAKIVGVVMTGVPFRDSYDRYHIRYGERPSKEGAAKGRGETANVLLFGGEDHPRDGENGSQKA